MDFDKWFPIFFVGGTAVFLILRARQFGSSINRLPTRNNPRADLSLWTWMIRATGVGMLAVIVFVVVLFRYWE